MKRLRQLLSDSSLTTTTERGVDPDFVEAIAFAWLAKRALLRKPGNVTSVTGARRSAVLGGIYQTT